MKTSFALDKMVGQYCQSFRNEHLKARAFNVGVVLPRFEASTRNIQSFEGGKSSNLAYLLLYYTACPDNETKQLFINGLSEVFDSYVKNKTWLDE